MNRLQIITFSLFLIPSLLFSQKKTAPLLGDCKDAVTIVPNGSYSFRTSPKGPGKVRDIAGNNMSSKYYFTEENNSAWFTFLATETSEFTFYIQPKDTLADFDFLLFEYTDKNFCRDLSQRKLVPLRSNISRFNPSVKSKTGLSTTSNETHVRSGPGNHNSKKLKLNKSSRYYLVINNSNSVETPFRIVFKNKLIPQATDSVLINGILTDDLGEPVKEASVHIDNSKGQQISETMSDPNTGEFSINVPIFNQREDLILSAEKDGYFFIEKKIKSTEQHKTVPLQLVIPKLEKGKDMVLNNILFEGNVAVVLPSSRNSMKRLQKLMSKNKSLVIKISGHTNGCGNGQLFSKQLSQKRAKKIKDFLVEKGIDDKRISTIGYGCTKMLYPITSSSEKQGLNRRVEILVVDY